MEESGSEGLEDLLKAEKSKFLAGTDFVCISDNYWLGKKKPCITYGLRGICYFCIEVGEYIEYCIKVQYFRIAVFKCKDMNWTDS